MVIEALGPLPWIPKWKAKMVPMAPNDRPPG